MTLSRTLSRTLSKKLSVSRLLTVGLAAVLLCSGWAATDALSAEPDPAVYYGWLDAYQNPGATTPPAPLPDTLPADQQASDLDAAGSEEPLVAQAEADQGLKRATCQLPHSRGKTRFLFGMLLPPFLLLASAPVPGRCLHAARFARRCRAVSKALAPGDFFTRSLPERGGAASHVAETRPRRPAECRLLSQPRRAPGPRRGSRPMGMPRSLRNWPLRPPSCTPPGAMPRPSGRPGSSCG